jgi:hypothetical protein
MTQRVVLMTRSGRSLWTWCGAPAWTSWRPELDVYQPERSEENHD